MSILCILSSSVKKDGLTSNEFISQSSDTLSNGEMAFGSIRGLNLLSPVALTEPRRKPRIVITQLDFVVIAYRKSDDRFIWPVFYFAL